MDYEQLWLDSIQDFQDELDYRLDSIRSLAETLPVAASKKNSDTVNEIFRELHSIKGTANLLGLDLIKTTAHKMEDVIVAIRDDRTPFTEEKKADFFSKIEMLRHMSRNLSIGINVLETENR